MSKIKETDFFKQTNILMTKKHKEDLNELKKRTILSNNLEVDNSTFIRAMIKFLMDNPNVLTKIKDYITQSRGSTYVTKFEVLLDDGATPEEMADNLGLDIDVVHKILKSIKPD